MASHSKLMIGVILLTVPSIQYGGYFLLTILSGKAKLSLTDFQKSMFRAGHAHAGVLVILAIIAQLLADQCSFGPMTEWIVRIGFPLAAILVSGGFFASAAGKNRTTPNSMVTVLYSGVFVLAACLVILGIGLLTSE